MASRKGRAAPRVPGVLALCVFLTGCSLAGPRPGPSPRAPDPGSVRSSRAPASASAPSASTTDPRTAAVPASPLSFPALRYPEIRGLWVVRGTLADRDSIRAMVERAHESGFNTLIVQIRGRGDAYFDSGIEPPSPLLPEGPDAFDPLRLVLDEAHARGLAVHGWVNTHLVASVRLMPQDPDHLVNRRPDLLAVPEVLAPELNDLSPFDPAYRAALERHARENSDRVEGLYTSPANPQVQDHVYAIWMDLVERYPLDGLHFDYVRYPSPEYDYSRAALEAFRAWSMVTVDPTRARELDRAASDDPLAWPRGLPEAWDDFRREQITGLVRRIHAGARERRPDLLVSAAVFANAEDAYSSRFQDWRGWLREGIVDVVAPMAYTANDDVFRSQVGDAVGAAGAGWRVWAGIGAYQNTFQGTTRKVELARESGAGGFLLFSYDWTTREARAPDGSPYLPALAREVFRDR